MKIDRKGPIPTPPDAGDVEGPKQTGKAKGAFRETLAGSGGPGGPGGPSGPGGPGGSSNDPVAAIARRLEAGEITPDEAVDEVIAAASDSGVLEGAPETLRSEIKQRLAALVGDDPFLAGKARRVGAGSTGQTGDE